MTLTPPTYTVSSSRRIAAPPEQIYGIIANYVTGHPRILPPRYFKDMAVEQGGYGEGTIVAVTMMAGGRSTRFSAAITEPIPGRLLVETPDTGGVVTSFQVEPVPDGPGADVTIRTEFSLKPGLAGAVERLAYSFLLRRIYRDELRILDTVARERAAAQGTGGAG